MPPKKEFRGPSNFCEWVVGTTIPTILGPEKGSKKQKSTKRDVIRVEVTTDDELGEDTLRITYPRNRSRRKKGTPQQEAKLKKVRFDGVPKKSVLKKAVKAYTISESSEEEGKTSDSNTEGSSDSSEAKVILIPENNIKVHTVKVSDDSRTDESSANDSEADSDPSPTCKCISCIRGRQKFARRRRREALLERFLFESEAASDSGTDDFYEANKTKLKGKNKGKKADEKKDSKHQAKKTKQNPKPATAETDESDTDAKDDADDESSENEAIDDKKKLKKKQNKHEDKKEQGDKEEVGKGDGDKKKKGKTEDMGKKQSENKSDKKEKKKEKTAKDKNAPKAYPEAMPGPNPRRPNLIEPIRAEVIQTERVIESQEDPPPNAYYDHINNVLRVYHGPVYGGHHNRGLYPVRDPANLALPLGTAHPMQNPYFYGFNNRPPQPSQPGQENKVTPQWPGGATAGMPWPYAPPAAPAPAPEIPAAPPPVNGSKGAFSDRAGRSNVAPAGVDGKSANPYYNGIRQQTSPFRSYNKGSPPYSKNGLGSKPGSRQASAGAWNNDGAPESFKQGSQNGAWDQKDTGGSQTQSAAGWGGSQAQQHQETDNWATGQTQQETAQTDTWGDADPSAQEGWGDTNEQTNQEWGDQQQSKSESHDATPESNVMPGTFETTWGDPTMAADTNGLVDMETQETQW